MKKLFISAVMVTLLCSCDDQNTVSTKETEVDFGYMSNLEIVKIEGCEYFYGDWSNATVLTHKGNCSNPIHKTLKSE